eukprot:3941025-Pleurochrysis_carterae.AAC.1
MQCSCASLVSPHRSHTHARTACTAPPRPSAPHRNASCARSSGGCDGGSDGRRAGSASAAGKRHGGRETAATCGADDGDE